MRVAWYTPLAARSAIAEYSAYVATALAQRCAVEVWAGDEPPWRAVPVRVVDGRSPALTSLADYDHVIYNVGDHPGFHWSIYAASSRSPGVCLLHDRSYDNLLGPDAPRGVSSSRAVLAGALGALVHADDHVRAIEREWFGPVGRIQFPVYPRHLSAGRGERVRRPERTFLTAGYVNPNKQIHRVLALLRDDHELRKRVRYVVVGPATDGEYARTLTATVERFGLGGCVELVFGYRTGAEFEAFLDAADVFVNLREPPLESASASFLEQLARGKPVVVSDLGYFSEVPDDAVLKVPPGDDEALRTVLWLVAGDDARIAEIGRRARTYAETLTVDRTCEGIIRFLEEVREWRPLMGLAHRAATELAAFGASAESAAIDQVARQLAMVARE